MVIFTNYNLHNIRSTGHSRMNIAEITTPESQKFIATHLSDSIHDLLLQAGKYKEFDVPLLTRQIESKNKAKNKLPLWFNTPGIVYPEKLSMEQCSSEITALYKAEILDGSFKRLIDLTGGLGVDSYFFSKKFEEVIYVEKNESLNELASYNFSVLKADNIQSVSTEAEEFVSSYKKKADFIFIDPARRKEGSKVFRFSDCEPNVTEMPQDLFEISEKIMIKASPLVDIDHAIRELKWVEKIFVVAVENECKELLFLLNKNIGDADIPLEITAANISQKGSKIEFKFIREEELKASAEISLPLVYIYEPNASIMKAGAFRSVGEKFLLKKLHPNSHLYTSEQLVKDFPGRIFKLESTLKYSKKEILNDLPNGKANITVRNFPDTVEAIRKKTGIKDGGEIYLFATTDKNGKHVILKTNKIL